MFKIDDTVTWTSQASGNLKTKEGVVAAVVPPGTLPDRVRFSRLYRGAETKTPRAHESYVVLVGTEPYWPRATQLKAGEAQADRTAM